MNKTDGVSFWWWNWSTGAKVKDWVLPGINSEVNVYSRVEASASYLCLPRPSKYADSAPMSFGDVIMSVSSHDDLSHVVGGKGYALSPRGSSVTIVCHVCCKLKGNSFVFLYLLFCFASSFFRANPNKNPRIVKVLIFVHPSSSKLSCLVYIQVKTSDRTCKWANRQGSKQESKQTIKQVNQQATKLLHSDVKQKNCSVKMT